MAAMQEKANVMPYSNDAFHQAARGVGAAWKDFPVKETEQLVFTVIKDCFLRNGGDVSKNFAAGIIHRHFDLTPDERTVEENGKAVAMVPTTNQTLYPSNWMLVDGNWYPYEFETQPVPQPPQAFLDDYAKVLQETGLEKFVGLVVYTDGVIGLEKTIDRANITEMQDEKLPIPDNYGPSAWAFF